MASLPSAIPGRYFIANEQETAGYSLTYLKDQFFFPDDVFNISAPDNALALFNEAAASVAVSRTGPLFFPWLYGERTPVEDSNLRAAFFNLNPSSTRAELIRATMEGVALNARWLLIAVEKFCKRRVETVNAIGGGARSAIWCQIMADVFDRPVNQMQDPQHAGTRGAAYLAMLGLGSIRLEEIARLARINETFYPDADRSRIYKEKFSYFTEFYRKNKSLFARINRSENGSS
jgi:xylulokinase